MKPTIVIGDVHGSYEQLSRLLESKFRDNRHVIFVGDLIDRGQRSRDVLDLVAKLHRDSPLTISILRGNHEQALLDFLKGVDAATFLRNGGISTIASYYRESPPPNVLEKFRRKFPEEHLSVLQSSVTHIETGEILISHMGYDPDRPNSRDLRAMVLEPHYKMFRSQDPRPAPLTICGHYAQRDGLPYMSDSLICIDTGCGTLPGAPLSALLLPERTVVQSHVEGEVR